jgi:hypothetical protein
MHDAGEHEKRACCGQGSCHYVQLARSTGNNTRKDYGSAVITRVEVDAAHGEYEDRGLCNILPMCCVVVVRCISL